MSFQQVRNCNFGRLRANATGSSGVGYTLFDELGAEIVSRTTSGVYQTAPGIYGAYVSFPDNFRGQIVWDTGSAFPTASYAAENFNIEENDPRVAQIHDMVTQVSGTTDILYEMQFGRWKIENEQMIFYKADNLTEIARFDLYDNAGVPTMDAVFERIKV